jgi:hypothetical protein
MASGESHWPSSVANGWDWRSCPVVFSYSFKAASNVEWKVEKEMSVLLVLDIILMGDILRLLEYARRVED